MRHHASLTTHLPSLSLASVFQAAAGRAWARTRPTRPYHGTPLCAEGVSSILRPSPGGHDVGGEMGGPSSSNTPSTHAEASSLCEARRRAMPSLSALAAFQTTPTPGLASSGAADNRGVGSMPLRPPTRRRVTSIDVESLSPHDIEPLRSASSGWPAYESEPPWEEIQASVPESLLPRVAVFRAAVARPLPHPTTAEDLVENLLHGLTAIRRASLTQALSYHAAHPNLQSTASYNLLIRYAIRNASFGTVRKLLQKMVEVEIAGDTETRALRVRSMVRSGLWNMAWEEELLQAKTDRVNMPLLVWLEFFESAKKGAFRGSTSSRRGSAKEMRKTPDPTVTAARFGALMEHLPAMSQAEWHCVPPRVTYALVRSLLDQDRRTTAKEVTRFYLQSLPRELDEGSRRACLAIIHLHMTRGRARNLSAHFAALSTLFAFLDTTHHTLRPTSFTLTILLRSLRSSRYCGERADKLVHSFRKRWGHDIVDDRVCRCWADLWLKQGSPLRAQAIVALHHALDAQRAELRAEKDATPDLSDKGRRRRLGWLDLHRAPRKNKERWHWRLLRRRLRKQQVRRPG